MKTTLALALLLICSPVLADPATPASPATPAAGASQMPSLLSELNSAKMIQFDSVVTGTDGKTAVPAIEVSGVYLSPESMDVAISKNGKIGSRVVSSSTKSIAYSYPDNTYLDFSTHDLTPDGWVKPPTNFIQSQVGEYSAGSFSLTMACVIKLSELLKVASLVAPAHWVHSEDVENGVTLEKETASNNRSGSTQTYTVTYTNSPLSLKAISFVSVSSVGDPGSSFNVAFSKYDIVSDPTQIRAVGPFKFTIPAGAKEWTTPPSTDTPF